MGTRALCACRCSLRGVGAHGSGLRRLGLCGGGENSEGSLSLGSCSVHLMALQRRHYSHKSLLPGREWCRRDAEGVLEKSVERICVVEPAPTIAIVAAEDDYLHSRALAD